MVILSSFRTTALTGLVLVGLALGGTLGAHAQVTFPDLTEPPALPGQAPQLPLPAPQVMAAPTPAPTPGPATAPATSGASGAATSSLQLKKDTLTLADVKDKLAVTPDLLWQQAFALQRISLLKSYDEQARKLGSATP